MPTPDLREHGLVLVGHPPLMVRFPADRPASSHPAVEVREVHDAQELAVAERLLVEAYPMPDLEPLATGDLLGPALLGGPVRTWLAWLDGTPVAVAAAHSHAGVTFGGVRGGTPGCARSRRRCGGDNGRRPWSRLTNRRCSLPRRRPTGL